MTERFLISAFVLYLAYSIGFVILVEFHARLRKIKTTAKKMKIADAFKTELKQETPMPKIIDLPNGAQWDTALPKEQQTKEAQEYVSSLMTAENKTFAEHNANGFDGDISNRFRQIFEADGLRLTLNTHFEGATGFDVKKGDAGFKYKLERIA